LQEFIKFLFLVFRTGGQFLRGRYNMKKTLYDVLGVGNTATAEEVDEAFRMRKEQLSDAGDRDSQSELKLVQHGHQILSDPMQRAGYDRKLAAEARRVSSVPAASSLESTEEGGGMLKVVLLIAMAFGGYTVYQKLSSRSKGAETALRVPAQAQSETTPSAQPVIRTEAAPPQIMGQQTQIQPQPIAPSGPADIYDIQAVPLPNPATQRNAYAAFLAVRGPRAFVICNDGRVMSYSGGAKFISQKLAMLPTSCSTYALDEHVVWTRK
jgi:hypothetical protein